MAILLIKFNKRKPKQNHLPLQIFNLEIQFHVAEFNHKFQNILTIPFKFKCSQIRALRAIKLLILQWFETKRVFANEQRNVYSGLRTERIP